MQKIALFFLCLSAWASHPASADTLISSATNYRALTYETGGIVLTPERIVLKGGKLWFRFNLVNNTEHSLTIDKVQLRLQLANGNIIAREGGVFNKHPALEEVPAGASHALYVEFKIGDEAQPVALLLDRGVISGGKHLALPPYKTSPVVKEADTEAEEKDSNW